jgi:hypothetical protein
MTTIKVEVPNGMAAEWEALNERSALRQAKFEAERGALVTVTTDGKIVWTNCK